MKVKPRMIRYIQYLVTPLLAILTALAPVIGHPSVQDFADMSLEELMNVTITGASRFEQRVSKAPAFVNVVMADDIKKYGHRTLADILRSLPGYYTTYDRIYDYLGIRGFSLSGDYNNRFLVLIDGHKVNENIYDTTGVGTDGIIDIDLFEKIEVIHGPGSSLYGGNAFFGVINIITKKGENIGGAQIAGSAGSFDTYTGRLTYGNKFRNGFEMLLSASGLDSRGDTLFFKEYNDSSGNFGETQGTDYDRGRSAFAKFSYRDFTFSSAYGKRTKGLPTAPYRADFNSRRNQFTDERLYLDAGYNHTFDNELTVQGQVSYNYYYFEGKYAYAPSLNIDTAEGTWWNGNLLFVKTFFDKHKVSVGGEYVRNTQQDQKNYDVNPFSTKLDDTRSSRRWAILVQDEFTILKNLVLNAGLRYDDYSTFGGTFNPRVAMIYNPFEKATLKLMYGSAFWAPNPYQLYYVNSITQKPNPSLDKETINTYEVVYEQYFLDKFRFAGGFFYSSIDNLILQQKNADGFFVFQNKGKASKKGVEMELEGTWKNGLKGRLSYTFQDARDEDTKRSLPNSPKHMAKLNLIAPLWQDKVFSGLEMQYMSNRKTLNGTKTGGFFVTNLTLFSQKLLNGLEVSASVYNLFDRKYSYPASNDHYPINAVEQDGRTFRIKFAYGF